MQVLLNCLRTQAQYVFITVVLSLVDQKVICESSVSAVFNSVRWQVKALSQEFTRLAGSRDIMK